VTDYEHVRSDYGTAEDLRSFVAEAHGRNLRVLLDFVPNHTSREHPYFRQAEPIGARSHYFDFFARDREDRATHYFDWEHLPNLRYDNPEVGRWMNEIAAEWVRSVGVDGYQIDAAWGVTRRNPEFWPEWSAELRRTEPELALLAEASPWLYAPATRPRTRGVRVCTPGCAPRGGRLGRAPSRRLPGQRASAVSGNCPEPARKYPARLAHRRSFKPRAPGSSI
jgi:glycosidase